MRSTVQIWKPQLLLLCFASKILTEANALLNLQVCGQRLLSARVGALISPSLRRTTRRRAR